MRTGSCLIVLSVLAAGCGDDGGLPETPKDLTMAALPDLTVPTPPDLIVVKDFTIPPDLSPPSDFSGVLCGNMTCAQNQKCCATVANMMLVQSCESSCDPDAGSFNVACDGPEDCMGNPCCAMVTIGGGGMQMGGGAACTNAPNACQINLGMGSLTTRLCHQNADCAGLMIPLVGPSQCCHEAGNPNVHICAAPINFMGFNFSCP